MATSRSVEDRVTRAVEDTLTEQHYVTAIEQPRVFRTGFLLVLCYFLAVQPSVVNFLRCAVSKP